MILTILSQLKNKSKEKENKTKNNVDKGKKPNSNKKEKVKKKKEKVKKNPKKQKKQKIGFLGNPVNHKNKIFEFLSNYLYKPQFFLLFIVFIVMMVKSTSTITSKTLYLSGHFEYLSDTKSTFIPDCTKMKKNEFLASKKVGDIVYYNYNKDLNSWGIDNKKGLKLKVIKVNDYYIFFEVLNLQNTVIDTSLLKEFSIYNMTETEVPLKHSFGNYQIYFSMNDAVNVLRDKFNIKEED